MAYCSPTDLLTGDIPLAGKYGDGTAFVNFAADEIDGQIGHIYITPVVLDESTPEKAARVRPVKLLLKKINILLASGRIILDQAAGTEDQNLHAYGASMVAEAIALLSGISSGKVVLVDTPVLAEDASNPNTGPSIVQEDPYSLVEGFYTLYQEPLTLAGRAPVMRPYDAETMEN